MWILLRKSGLLLMVMMVAILGIKKYTGGKVVDSIPDDRPAVLLKEFASPSLLANPFEIERAVEKFSKHGIDIMFITIPADENPAKVSEKYFVKWKMGKKYGERGMLIALNRNASAFRVSRNLAPWISQDFLKIVSDEIMQPSMRAGNMDKALLYVFHEIHGRLNSDPEQIRTRDVALKAEARRNRTNLDAWIESQQPVEEVAEAWNRLMKSLSSQTLVKGFTMLKTGEIVFRKYSNAKQNELYRTFRHSEIRIFQNNDKAVVFPHFSERIMAPFFFIKTPDGWRFDAVSTERCVHQTGSNYSNWKVALSGNPYGDLILSSGMNINAVNLPFHSPCYFDPHRDDAVHGAITDLEKSKRSSPLELARLLTMAGGPLDEIELHCNEAIRADPRLAAPYLYLATACVEEASAASMEKAWSALTRMLSIPHIMMDENDAVTAGNFMAYLSGSRGDADAMLHYADYVLGIRRDCYAWRLKIEALEQRSMKASPIMKAGISENIVKLREGIRFCE